MRKYDKYKDSGIAWIGEIPEGWKVIQLKFVIQNLDYLREPISAELRERNNPLYNYYGASGVIDKIDYYNVDDKVLLIGEDGANLITRNLPLIYKASGKFWVNNHAHILKTLKNDYNYMAHLLECADYSIYITGSAQPKLSQENLGRVLLPIPPIPEQQSIATYLDNKVGEIDGMIEKTEKKIALYEELKKSIITRAVTKGLNPHAKMKDSGVEWIGEIPEGWETAKLRRISKIMTGTTPPTSNQSYYDSKEIEWYTPSDFASSSINLNKSSRNLSKKAFEEGKIFLYPRKTTLIIGIGGTLGKIGWTEKESASNQQINAIIANENNLSKFFAYYLFVQNSYIWSMANTSTMPILNQASTKDLIVPIPPLPEQQSIATYLDTKTTAIDSQIAIARKRIDLLKELKSSLITQVVTGKMKVC